MAEVYPHPALVELSKFHERLPYKASKVGKYWPSLTSGERRLKLFEQWAAIVALLEDEISGVAACLPPIEVPIRGFELKGYEDRLDAVVCAWVGICILEGRAAPFGDETSAIWIPSE